MFSGKIELSFEILAFVYRPMDVAYSVNNLPVWDHPSSDPCAEI